MVKVIDEFRSKKEQYIHWILWRKKVGVTFGIFGVKRISSTKYLRVSIYQVEICKVIVVDFRGKEAYIRPLNITREGK